MTLLPPRPLPFLSTPVRSEDEQRLLALTLRSADVADVVLDPAVLRATDFYHDYHCRIFTAMKAIQATSQPVSIASVSLELRRRGWEDESAYVFDTLLDCLHFSYGSEDVAAWIKALQQRRKAGELQDLQKDAIAAVESGDPAKMQAAYKALVDGISDTPKTPAGYTLYSYSSLLTLPPQRWLVDGEIPANGLSMLVGPSRGGKSFVMTDRAMRVALAHPDQAVIYIAPEGGSGYRKRMDAWCQHHGVTPPENLYFILDTVPLLDATKRDLFLASLGTLKPVLIVVDTLARSMIGGDENSAKDIGLLIDACDHLRRATGAAVQLVHHTGKNGSGYRGSSALFGGLDVITELANDDGLITLSCGKSKDSADPDPQYLRLVEAGESCVVLPAERVIVRGNKLTTAQRKILETLNLAVFVDCGAKHSQICDVAGLASPTVYKALSTLKTRGLISQGFKGDPYRITSEGQEALMPTNSTNHTDSSSTNYPNYTYSSEYSSSNRGDSSPVEAAVQAELSSALPLPNAQLSQLSTNSTQLSDSSLSTISPLSPLIKGDRERVDRESEELPAYHTITLRDGTTLNELVLTTDWQIVPAGWTVPAGAAIQMDLQGSTKARLALPQYDYELTRARELFEAGDREELAAFVGRQRGTVRRVVEERIKEWER